VRKLLIDAGQRLAELAEEQFRERHLEAAASSIALAEQCAALGGRALALRQQISAALRKREQRRAWVAGRLEEAERLAGAGSFDSALDLLDKLGRGQQAAELRTMIEQRRARFRRHLGECRRCLEAGQAQAAHRHWQKARQVAPDDPELTELATAVARALAADSGGAAESLPVTDRAQRFLLGNLALVVSAGEVCVGTPRGDGVHVPILGRLHGRHAVFLRDPQGWQVAACRDRHGGPCTVLVDGQPVESVRRLHHGQRIELGGLACTWEFRLPVRASATAVLEPAPGSQLQIWTPAGMQPARVALLDDALVIRAAGAAHIVVPELPCKELILRWDRGRLTGQVEGGLLAVEIPGRTLTAEDKGVYIPSRLMIQPRLEEAELLGRMAAGCEPAEQLVLEIVDPLASPGRARSSFGLHGSSQ